MSWNKKIFDFFYKRSKFDYLSWLIKDQEDDYNDKNYSWLEETNMGWNSYKHFGAPNNMDELAQSRLLTLLRKLKLQTAKEICHLKHW
jgi:hypothetical protein